MRVIKRNGYKSEIEFDEITRKIKTLSLKEPRLNIDAQKLAINVISMIYDGITTSELDEFTASTAASMSLYNTDYDELSSRLIINNHKKNTNGSFCETMLSLDKYIDDNIINLCSSHKEDLDNIIVHSRDYLISYFGFNTLYKSYLLKIDNKPVERPQYLFLRVAMGIHANEKMIEKYPDKEIVQNADILSPAYLVFNNYEVILKWNRSLRFALAVCTLKDKIKNEL